MTGRRRPAIGTRKSFKEFCSGLFEEGQIYKDKQVRVLLSSSGTIPDRQGTRPRRRIRSGVGGDRVSRGRKLLFQAQPTQRLAASIISTIEQTQSFPIFVKRNCATPSRKTQRRPLHLASEIASRLGNRAAVRQRFRHLRLVRRPNELHQLRRLRSKSLNFQLSTLNFPR